MRLDLLNEIGNLYDNNCKLCPVKRGRDGNKRTNGKPVRTDKERCVKCPIEIKIKKLRKQMEG